MDEALPDLVVAADPDSVRTALAWAHQISPRVYGLRGISGGGSGKNPVKWQSITGVREWLTGAALVANTIPARVTAVVELQAPNGEHSRDVEPLRRVRYHWDAACELLGCEYVEADPNEWEAVFSEGKRCPGRGARKKACNARANALTEGAHVRPINEDQRDAFGILHWYIVSVLGCELRIPKS